VGGKNNNKSFAFFFEKEKRKKKEDSFSFFEKKEVEAAFLKIGFRLELRFNWLELPFFLNDT